VRDRRRDFGVPLNSITELMIANKSPQTSDLTGLYVYMMCF
jgi:hypothetical protein